MLHAALQIFTLDPLESGNTASREMVNRPKREIKPCFLCNPVPQLQPDELLITSHPVEQEIT